MPKEPVDFRPVLGTGPVTDKHQLASAMVKAMDARETAYSDAWVRWYEHLAEGYFDPRVRDRTGETLCLNRAGWKSPGWGPRGWVAEDFVSPDDPWQPSPSDAQIDGYLRPVFFLRDVLRAIGEIDVACRARKTRQEAEV